jgi:hypothetical protein
MVTTFSKRNHAIVFALQSFTGADFSHLFKYYVVVMMYLDLDLLVGGLMGPLKSTTHFSNTCKVTWDISGISSLLDFFPHFDIHHGSDIILLHPYVM